jgi:ribose transport system substrate-binding protein
LRAAGALVAAVLLLVLTACGGSDGSSGGSTGGGTGAAVDQAALDKAYTGVSGELPDVTTQPQPGVKMWVVSCGQQSQGCVEPVEAAMAAGRAAGWDVTMCDGKLNPGDWGACVRQGISAQQQVIMTIGIDCPAITGPLQEARTAGVVTINNGGFDCDVVGGM